MPLGILGKKLGMTQIFDEKGVLTPVTVVSAGPCQILQIKTKEKDGYSALQLGFDQKSKKATNKPQMGHFGKSGSDPLRFVREVRIDNESEYEVGQTIDVNIFEKGEHVDVTGITKGRGFQGTIRRYHTRRGPETHGSRHHRRPGSSGASAHPSHVFKGKKNPGQMGSSRATTLNLTIIKTDKEKNLILIKGSVPGHINGYIMIRKPVRKRNINRSSS